MKKLKAILLLLVLLLCGCGTERAEDKNDIPRVPWPEREEGAGPYVCLPGDRESHEYSWRENFKYPGAERKTALEEIKELPAGEEADFAVRPKMYSYFEFLGIDPEAVPELSAAAAKAERSYEAIENKQSPEAEKARQNVKAAYRTRNELINAQDLEIYMYLAEGFAEKGARVRLLGYKYMEYGEECFDYILAVRETPERFQELIKSVDGVASAELMTEGCRSLYTELIWESGP